MSEWPKGSEVVAACTFSDSYITLQLSKSGLIRKTTAQIRQHHLGASQDKVSFVDAIPLGSIEKMFDGSGFNETIKMAVVSRSDAAQEMAVIVAHDSGKVAIMI